jgi:hypothetical protein
MTTREERFQEINQAIRVDTADVLESRGHIYWALRLRLLPPITNMATAGRGEDLLAEINDALHLGLTEFERRAV